MPEERPLVTLSPNANESLAEKDRVRSSGGALDEIEDESLEALFEETVWESLSEEQQNAAIAEKRERKKGRMAAVLERGIVNERLAVDLPSDIHGEWVEDDPVQVARMETLGFKIDDTYAVKRRLHSKGDSASYVGDVVFMTCSREDYDLFEEIRQERFDQMHGPKHQKEDTEYAVQVQSKTPEVPVIEESRTRAARREDLNAALAATIPKPQQ